MLRSRRRGRISRVRYHLTFLYLPPPDAANRTERFFYERAEATTIAADIRTQLAAFQTETDRAFAMLAAILPEVRTLSDAETLTYLHGTISEKAHAVAVPPTPAYLDALLCDTPLTGGLEPKLGSLHLRMLTVTGFPNVTTPGLLDALNDLGFAYRWMTRWIPLDKTEATRQLTKLRRHWFAKRKSVTAVLREVMFNRETALVDPDADAKAGDADSALEELGSDDVAYGYLTATLVVVGHRSGSRRREAAGGRADHQRPRLRHHSRKPQRGRGVARIAAGQPLRQHPPTHRAHAQSRAHDARLRHLGRS